MAREQFIENLRSASRMLSPPTVSSGQDAQVDTRISKILHSSDLWLTPKSVEGFDAADFTDWPDSDRERLEREVRAFVAITEGVQPDKPATRTQSNQARKHLEEITKIVRQRLLHEWLEAQRKMMEEATAAATANKWYVEKDEKEVLESLLGRYKAPRLRIRTPDQEVVLDPIARFGSGHRGVVDLVVMPTYETAYLLAFKDGEWQIVSPRGTGHTRRFSQATLVNTITKLPHT
jgi:hypothetical protein